ncbi:MAG: hypothetical protein IJQ02_04830 [Oscillospiraceae bacterium]|nr:hypothetical protein [Oscillospiraceae bacterium]
MKKTITVFLLIAMVLTLCACGQSGQKTAAPEVTPTPEPTPSVGDEMYSKYGDIIDALEDENYDDAISMIGSMKPAFEPAGVPAEESEATGEAAAEAAEPEGEDAQNAEAPEEVPFQEPSFDTDTIPQEHIVDETETTVTVEINNTNYLDYFEWVNETSTSYNYSGYARGKFLAAQLMLKENVHSQLAETVPNKIEVAYSVLNRYLLGDFTFDFNNMTYTGNYDDYLETWASNSQTIYVNNNYPLCVLYSAFHKGSYDNTDTVNYDSLEYITISGTMTFNKS